MPRDFVRALDNAPELEVAGSQMFGLKVPIGALPNFGI